MYLSSKDLHVTWPGRGMMFLTNREKYQWSCKLYWIMANNYIIYWNLKSMFHSLPPLSVDPSSMYLASNCCPGSFWDIPAPQLLTGQRIHIGTHTYSNLRLGFLGDITGFSMRHRWVANWTLRFSEKNDKGHKVRKTFTRRTALNKSTKWTIFNCLKRCYQLPTRSCKYDD